MELTLEEKKHIHFIQRLKLSKNFIYGAVADKKINKKIRTDWKCANVQSFCPKNVQSTHGMDTLCSQYW